MKKCMGCMRDYGENSMACPICGYSDAQMQEDVLNFPDALRPETILAGRFVIGRVLSYSEYFIIYISWDALLQRRVVLREYLPLDLGERDGQTGKILFSVREEKEAFEAGGQMFWRETIRLTHRQEIEGIANVYRSFKENGTVYQVMEYLEGLTLQDFLTDYPESRKELLIWILPQITETVRVLHQSRMLHGELNPDHVYLTGIGPEGSSGVPDLSRARVKLIGFAMAKEQFGREILGLKTVGEVPGFTAPEVLAGEPRGVGADLYGLGAIAYWLLTGRELSAKKRRPKYPPNTQNYENVIQKLTAWKPESRPQNLDELYQMCNEIERRRFFAGGQK